MTLAGAHLSSGGKCFAAAAFVLLAGSTVLVPVALPQAVGEQADLALATMRALLIRHESRGSAANR